MTREEKIKRLKALKARCERLIVSSDRVPEEWRKDAEALDLAVAALRFPTREMVERVRGEWVKTSEYMPIFGCSKCGERTLFRSRDNVFPDFCPACGAPTTDEAVDMMLERWKEVISNG